MSTSLAAIVGLVLLTGTATSEFRMPIQQNDDVREYCHMETFQPRCTHGDVISMTSAMFGRMHVGRCIAPDAFQLQNPDSLGCSANVLGYFDRVCSGKSSCDVLVPNPDLYSYRPCSAHLTTYLEASYFCVSVVDEDRSCSIVASVGSPLYVSNSLKSTQQSGNLRCGSSSNPWVVEAQTGQQITVSMIDFAQRQEHHGDGVNGEGVSSKRDKVVENQQDSCGKRYGYIVDKATPGTSPSRKNITICADESVVQRTRFIHHSKGSLVKVVLTSINVGRESNQNYNFLLGFEAVGCSNLVPPADAWLRRTDNEATVGCYTTRQRWHLRCQEGHWKGTIGQCTETNLGDEDTSPKLTKIEMEMSHNGSFVNLLVIVAVTFIGLAVCLIVIFIGIGYSHRYQRQLGKIKQSEKLQQQVEKTIFNGNQIDSSGTAINGRHQYYILEREPVDNETVLNPTEGFNNL